MTLFWLIAIPILASPVNYLAGRLIPQKKAKTRGASPAYWLALVALLAAWVPFIQAVQSITPDGAATFEYGAVQLRLDGFSLILSGLTLALGVVVVLFSGPYLAGEEGEEKYYALLTAMIGAIIGLACANDLFNLWVWFETMAISSYMLVAFYRQQKSSLEAGFKYLVQSAAGSVLVLLGLALVFAQTGSLSFDGIRAGVVEKSGLLLAAGALFLIGFGVKTALVPLHTWLPDAHSQAPSGISAMLSGVVIEAGLVALLKTLAPLAGVTNQWGPILLGFAAVNMLAGNLLALRQTEVKRLLAFSSLSHMGYILLGIGLSVTYGSQAAAQGGLFHLLTHGLMKGLAFLSAGCLLYTLILRQGKHTPLTIADLAGAAKRYPLVAFGFSAAVLGLGGLPPLAGFMSKWQIFVAGFQTASPAAIALVIFAALNSVLSLGYYAPIVNALYRQEPSPAVRTGAGLPALMNLAVGILTLAVVLLGFWPTLVSGLTGPAAAVLTSSFVH